MLETEQNFSYSDQHKKSASYQLKKLKSGAMPIRLESHPSSTLG